MSLPKLWKATVTYIALDVKDSVHRADLTVSEWLELIKKEEV